MYTQTNIHPPHSLKTSEAMAEALEAGARRRALIASLQTPPPKGPVKRALTASPSASATTVTPEAKRIMHSESSSVVESSTEKEVTKVVEQNAEPKELFPVETAITHIEEDSQEQQGVMLNKPCTEIVFLVR